MSGYRLKYGYLLCFSLHALFCELFGIHMSICWFLSSKNTDTMPASNRKDNSPQKSEPCALSVKNCCLTRCLTPYEGCCLTRCLQEESVQNFTKWVLTKLRTYWSRICVYSSKLKNLPKQIAGIGNEKEGYSQFN